MKFNLNTNGYSLIEMLFMLLILGVLCGTVALSFQELQNRVHIQAASEALLSDILSARAEALGDRIMAGFRTALAGVEHVVDIRGKGCMIGIELNKPCKSLFPAAMAAGLIINVTADSVIRLLPSFIMTDDEADQVVAILAPLIKDFTQD